MKQPGNSGDRPYLSIVTCSRNDDHGGRLIERMQHFVDGLEEQCRHFGLDAELILVEWNPPAERPRLAEALRLPAEPGPLAIRIIEVPPEIHARYRHARELPLYQMIAKNVGICRARGEFVLATNIDILFSDALMARLARHDLKPGVMYRIDRHDAAMDVPVGVPIAEKLAWCADHVIRVHRREGSWFPAERRMDHIYRPMILIWLRALLAPLALFGFPFLLSGYRLRRSPRPLFSGFRRFIRLKMLKKTFTGFRRHVYIIYFMAGILIRVLPTVVLRSYYRYNVSCWKSLIFEIRRKRVHTNACGDFTLMARNDWDALHGYWEMDAYSFHIDSLLCHAAIAGGRREEVFPEPARIYHIEHGSGSGFTPENQKQLWKRIDRARIPRLDDRKFWSIAIALHEKKRPLVFNDSDWGLAEDNLPEVRLPEANSDQEPHQSGAAGMFHAMRKIEMEANDRGSGMKHVVPVATGKGYYFHRAYYVKMDLSGYRPNLVLVDKDSGLVLFETNAWGLRGKDADPDKPKIVVWGDSIVFGAYTPIARSWVDALGEQLRDHQVFNGGIEGDGTRNIISRMVDVNANHEVAWNLFFPGWHDNFKISYDLYDDFMDRAGHLKNLVMVTVPTLLDDRTARTDLSAAFQDGGIADTYRNFWGSEPYSIETARQFLDFIQHRNDQVRRLARDLDLPLIDLHAFMNTKKETDPWEHFFDIGHLRPAAFQLVGNFVAGKLHLLQAEGRKN